MGFAQVGRRVGWVVAIWVSSVAQETAWAVSPADQIQTTIKQALEILNDPKLKGDAKEKERREELRKVILPRFDFAEMSKRSLGYHWKLYPDRQKEFTVAFSDHLQATYLATIETYSREKIVQVDERLDGDFAQVDTRMITREGKGIPITYRLHLVRGDWKVYDVVVEGVSVVNNFRSQFNRILAKSSFDHLLKELRNKQEERKK